MIPNNSFWMLEQVLRCLGEKVAVSPKLQMLREQQNLFDMFFKTGKNKY